MNCITDLGGKKSIGKKFFKKLNIGKTYISGGGYMSLTYRNSAALRLEGIFGNISTDDKVLAGKYEVY